MIKSQPQIILHGYYMSKMIIPDEAVKIFKELKKSKLVILQKVKHSILLERPNEIIINIIKFISNI